MFMQVAAPANDILGTMDGVAIAAAVARGELGATEAVAAAIKRLQAVNPELNAIACERFTGAAFDASGEVATTMLAGVPSLLKDNIDIAGLPTRHGSTALPTSVCSSDSAITAQFRATGLIPIAKTRLPEFGLTATTEFSRSPPTRNPWNTGYSCGGSSGGAAALVAAGVVPIAHANDGGGSIRIPAACCGVVGLKPSRNRLCHAQFVDRLPINIVTDGVVSRTVRDTAAF
jgi:amidase